VTSDDLSCQPVARQRVPQPTPQEWGLEQALQAPPWNQEQWKRALACLGVIEFADRGGEG
jgi:hypothetical protein